MFSKEIYKEFNIDKDHSQVKNIFLSINNFKFSENIYSLPNLFVNPLPSYRVDSKIISLISKPYSQEKSLKDKKMFLYNVRSKKGKRKLKNIYQCIDLFSKILLDFDIREVIIDGLTSLPNYLEKCDIVKKYSLDKSIIKNIRTIT